MCIRYEVTAEWLLFGRGGPNADTVDRAAQLKEASPRELLIEVARRWEAIEQALDVLEVRLTLGT